MNLIVNIFCGIEIFLRVGLRYFRRGGGVRNFRGGGWGVEKLSGGGGGLKKLSGGVVEKFSGGGGVERIFTGGDRFLGVLRNFQGVLRKKCQLGLPNNSQPHPKNLNPDPKKLPNPPEKI